MFRQKFLSNPSRVLLYIRRVMILVERDVSTRVEIWTQAVALAETWQIAQNQRNILSNKRNIVPTSPDATFSHGFIRKKKSGTYKRYASIFCPSLDLCLIQVFVTVICLCLAHSLPFCNNWLE